MPVIVPELRAYISQNVFPIMCRDDLTDTMESLLGDCFGPGSVFDSQRQHISTYAFDHYGDLDTEQTAGSSVLPGSIVKLLNQSLSLVDRKVRGPVIDIGCSVGRTSFELAQKSEDIVLGIDMNFAMLKTAAVLLEKGYVSFPKRHVGVTYERREFPAVFEKTENLDFWVCDAAALPFPDEAFSTGVSLNVLDCMPSPYDHLKELARILKTGGEAVLSTPYDWTPNATPIESWIGGHSQRSENKGASDAMLRSMFAGGGHPSAFEELKLTAEKEIPWTLRLHDRSSMEYLVHMIAIRKSS